MSYQDKLTEEKDEFVESLGLTPEKIRADLEKMRDIDGFPKGEADDIFDLSEPPYFTAYPNPYIKNFIDFYGNDYDAVTDEYDSKPYVGDLKTKKNNMIYRLHSYHTKVPFEGVQKLIEFYTEKGDIVLDVFSGTGMTGIASQFSGRNAILIDLSSVAAFMSYNYNKVIDVTEFENDVLKILEEIEQEYSWLFETEVNNKKAIVNFFVWSINYQCPHCSNQFVYYDAAYDPEEGKISTEFECPSCGIQDLTKKTCETVIENKFDVILNKNVLVPKYSPILLNYSFKGERKSYEKRIDRADLEILKKTEKLNFSYWIPVYKMLFKGKKWGDSWRAGYHSGIEYSHQFYYKRTLYILTILYHKLREYDNNYYLFYFTSLLSRMYSMNRFIPKTNGSGVVGPLSGTLYLSQMQVERNPLEYLKSKLKNHSKVKKDFPKTNLITSTQSSTDLSNIPECSIDYIFIDPPFGDNLMYSELNFLSESWLKIFTNQEKEAIMNKSQNKELFEYSSLMTDSFKEMYRVLKPNRWITVEFHNSRADVWKSIQNSLSKAGFIIAQVAVLDKKKGTTKQLTYSGTVKNDLIINAYKPDKIFSNTFLQKAGLNMEIDFIQMHLDKLPIEQNVERTSQMLYSKLLAQYIQNAFEVRMDATEFYDFLKNNFEERDGIWFNPDQIPKYEKIKTKNPLQIDPDQSVLGISDEKSTINWLLKFLENPRTYSEIYTEFTKIILTSEDKMPELKTILNENFTTEGGKYRLPSDLERKEIEEIREKRLIKEFNEIFDEAQSKRKIKEVRKEALIHGLMELYRLKDVEKIKFLGERLDRNIIDSDDDISAIIDWAMYN